MLNDPVQIARMAQFSCVRYQNGTWKTASMICICLQHLCSFRCFCMEQKRDLDYREIDRCGLHVWHFTPTEPDKVCCFGFAMRSTSWPLHRHYDGFVWQRNNLTVGSQIYRLIVERKTVYELAFMYILLLTNFSWINQRITINSLFSYLKRWNRIQQGFRSLESPISIVLLIYALYYTYIIYIYIYIHYFNYLL